LMKAPPSASIKVDLPAPSQHVTLHNYEQT
jgi:hypothetical protein